MADYRELLRRAIAALPENNGAARRAVYEKARSALVGQLRAITPPLPARDITQHRLKLEDCIRQVEQEASEAIISLGRDSSLAPRPETPPPAPIQPPRPLVSETPKPVAVDQPKAPEASVAPVRSAPSSVTSIEDIISQASATSGAPVKLLEDAPKPEAKPEAKPDDRPASAITIPARPAETAPPRAPGYNVRPLEQPQKAPSFEPRRESAAPLAANSVNEPIRVAPRVEPSLGNQAVARQQVVPPLVLAETAPVETALSSVREVELEPDASESQVVIERAIETLDRAARGESIPADSAAPQASPPPASDPADDAGFAEPSPARGGGGLTIFLIVFIVLLAGVGGGGYWAWREGYIDLDQMFGQAQTSVAETTTPATNTTPTLDPVQGNESGDAAAVPGNTAPAATPDESAAIGELELDERLEPTPEPVQPTGNESVLPSIGTGEVKTEERLPGQDSAAIAANDPAASVDPAVLAGSQSLLLEASPDGSSGAVPFSGTVEWSQGVDELGLPTLVGEASIPARNLSVDITIRKNSDPSLPASHLMEVDFNVSDTFIGGTIANLPGVLLKDQELVPGTALVGASARVVGNSFLFALSATPTDTATNTNLLENRRWMDLAVVYGTGRNAIITLEKDDAAQALFQQVFTTWAQ